jgi:hypothetical protein
MEIMIYFVNHLKHPIATAVIVGLFLGAWQGPNAQPMPGWIGTPAYIPGHHAYCRSPVFPYGGYWRHPVYLWLPIYVPGGVQQHPSESEEDEMPETPPINAQALSEIVHRLEEKGLGRIVEIEFEDEVWEVELVREGELVELRVDPLTAEIYTESD